MLKNTIPAEKDLKYNRNKHFLKSFADVMLVPLTGGAHFVPTALDNLRLIHSEGVVRTRYNQLNVLYSELLKDPEIKEFLQARSQQPKLVVSEMEKEKVQEILQNQAFSKSERKSLESTSTIEELIQYVKTEKDNFKETLRKNQDLNRINPSYLWKLPIYGFLLSNPMIPFAKSINIPLLDAKIIPELRVKTEFARIPTGFEIQQNKTSINNAILKPIHKTQNDFGDMLFASQDMSEGENLIPFTGDPEISGKGENLYEFTGKKADLQKLGSYFANGERSRINLGNDKLVSSLKKVNDLESTQNAIKNRLRNDTHNWKVRSIEEFSDQEKKQVYREILNNKNRFKTEFTYRLSEDQTKIVGIEFDLNQQQGVSTSKIEHSYGVAYFSIQTMLFQHASISNNLNVGRVEIFSKPHRSDLTYFVPFKDQLHVNSTKSILGNTFDIDDIISLTPSEQFQKSKKGYTLTVDGLHQRLLTKLATDPEITIIELYDNQSGLYSPQTRISHPNLEVLKKFHQKIRNTKIEKNISLSDRTIVFSFGTPLDFTTNTSHPLTTIRGKNVKKFVTNSRIPVPLGKIVGGNDSETISSSGSTNQMSGDMEVNMSFETFQDPDYQELIIDGSNEIVSNKLKQIFIQNFTGKYRQKYLKWTKEADDLRTNNHVTPRELKKRQKQLIQEVQNTVQDGFIYGLNHELNNKWRFTGGQTEPILKDLIGIIGSDQKISCATAATLNSAILSSLGINNQIFYGFLQDFNEDAVISSGEGHAWVMAQAGMGDEFEIVLSEATPLRKKESETVDPKNEEELRKMLKTIGIAGIGIFATFALIMSMFDKELKEIGIFGSREKQKDRLVKLFEFSASTNRNQIYNCVSFIRYSGLSAEELTQTEISESRNDTHLQKQVIASFLQRIIENDTSAILRVNLLIDHLNQMKVGDYQDVIAFLKQSLELAWIAN